MAEQRFSNVYNQTIGPICAKSFATVSNLKHVVTKYFDTKIVRKKVNNYDDSLDRLYKCKFIFDLNKNRKLAKKRPSLHFMLLYYGDKRVPA